MRITDLAALRGDIPGYGELRLHFNKRWSIAMLKGSVTGNTQTYTGGLSARVLSGKNWGMASSPELTGDSLRTVLVSAKENAIALSARYGGESPSAAGRAAVGSWDHRTVKNKVTQKEKLDFLADLDAYVAKTYPDLLSRRLILTGIDQEKSVVTSDGAEGYSYIPRAHIYLFMTAEKDGAPIDLMAPAFGGLGEYEDFFSNPEDFYPMADNLYEKLMKKREGVYPQAGTQTCILAPDLAGILAHEAVGHTVEADVVLVGSVAGELMGKRVASELVSMTDFAHTAFGETCPVPVYCDDEGVLAEDQKLIENGILTGLMHNRETASRFGAAPLGNARGFEFSDEPLIRMRNTCVLPGTSKLEDMIASVEDGYYLEMPSNGQADTTSEFMFGVSMGYEIKNGKLGRAILDTTVSGVAFDLLKTVTAVSGDMEWVSSGFCGKKQIASVGMGGPALLCQINLGGR